MADEWGTQVNDLRMFVRILLAYLHSTTRGGVRFRVPTKPVYAIRLRTVNHQGTVTAIPDTMEQSRFQSIASVHRSWVDTSSRCTGGRSHHESVPIQESATIHSREPALTEKSEPTEIEP